MDPQLKIRNKSIWSKLELNI